MLYRFGRFSFELPSEWAFQHQAHELLFVKVSEFRWEQEGLEWRAAALGAWQDRLEQIRVLPPPEDHEHALVETKNYASSEPGPFAGAFYFDDMADDERGTWIVLCAYPEGGAWFLSDGFVATRGELLEDLEFLATNYRPGKPEGEIAKAYHLERGLLATPYIDQEDMFVAFKHRAGTLKVQTRSIEEPSTTELMKRLEGVVATNFGLGLKIKTLRKGSRTVAGMKGQEILTLMEDGDRSELTFMFLFNGKEDSGDFPKFTIQLDANASEEQAMILLWDRLLDSIKSLSRG